MAKSTLDMGQSDLEDFTDAQDSQDWLQLRAENISMMKRLHWFDKKKLKKKFKGRLGWKTRKLDETFVLRRESELEEIRQ